MILIDISNLSAIMYTVNLVEDSIPDCRKRCYIVAEFFT